MEEKKYLDEKGLEKVFTLLNTVFANKVDNDKLIPLTIEEYNQLDEEDKIDNEAYYFIIDEDDVLFDRINQMYEDIDEIKNFINNFPIDNHCYGIVNRLPKYLGLSGLDEPSSDSTDNEFPKIDE